MLLYLQFIVLAGMILFAGVRIARYGDVIAEKTGLGRTWVGSVLIGTTTSLPELTTGISSVTYVAAPDIVMGNVAGDLPPKNRSTVCGILWTEIKGGRT